MKGKDTIINEMVLNTACVMEAKVEYNELVAQQMEAKGDINTATNLRAYNKRIADAINVIRASEGCWA